MQDYAALAKISGFTDAAFLPVRELVVVPEYRRFCEQNLCGNYGVLPVCPPMSGTVEEMTAVMQRYKTALVLMIETTPFDYRDTAEQKTAKKHQNLLTEQLSACALDEQQQTRPKEIRAESVVVSQKSIVLQNMPEDENQDVRHPHGSTQDNAPALSDRRICRNSL